MSTINPPASSRDTSRQTRTQPTESERAAAAAMLPMIWGIHISRCRLCRSRAGHRRPPRRRPGKLARNWPGQPAPTSRRCTACSACSPRSACSTSAVQPRSFEPDSAGGPPAQRRTRGDAVVGRSSWRHSAASARSSTSCDTVRTGEPGFEPSPGNASIFEFLAQNPRSAAIFDAAMSERTAAFAPSVADSYDFSDIRTVVDVGGGTGNPAGGDPAAARATCTASCSRPRPSQPVPTRCSTRSTSRIAARCWQETSSSTFQTEQTATCWRTSCTTGTTRERSRSCATAAKRWPGAAGS